MSAIVALLLVAPAAAQSAALEVEMDGDIEQVGPLIGLAIDAGWGPEQTAALKDMKLEGASITADEWRQPMLRVNQPVCDPVIGCVGDVSRGQPEKHTWPQGVSSSQVQAALADVQDGAHIHVFPIVTGSANMAAQLPHVTNYAAQDVCLNRYGIDGHNTELGMARQSTAPCGDFKREDRRSSELQLGDNLVVSHAPNGGALQITGDFVLEMNGIVLDVNNGTEAWRSGKHADPTFQSAAGGLVDSSLFRIFVYGGTLQIHYGAGLEEADFVLQNTKASATRAILAVDDQRLEGDYIVESQPRGDFMNVQVAPMEPQQIANSPASIMNAWWMIAVGSVLALVAAVLVARRMRTPSMHSVERMLERGDFDKAATLSSRILMRRPSLESAHLSRAIAWARGGHPQRVVASLGPYLSSHAPQDGTLHYVLGLAHLDLGDRVAARQAMEHAVQLTPDLLAELSPDLRPRGTTDGHAYS